MVARRSGGRRGNAHGPALAGEIVAGAGRRYGSSAVLTPRIEALEAKADAAATKDELQQSVDGVSGDITAL